MILFKLTSSCSEEATRLSEGGLVMEDGGKQEGPPNGPKVDKVRARAPRPNTSHPNPSQTRAAEPRVGLLGIVFC